MSKWLLLLLLSIRLTADEISLEYQLMDKEMFEQIVVGNTVIGVTRQSHSLYMLHFQPEGSCELWKQDRLYSGEWWMEQDHEGRTIVRAFWPEYRSSEPASLFSPDNPSYGKPTALRYYFNRETTAILIAGKKFIAPVTLASGKHQGR